MKVIEKLWKTFIFWVVVNNKVILTSESEGIHEDPDTHLVGSIFMNANYLKREIAGPRANFKVFILLQVYILFLNIYVLWLAESESESRESSRSGDGSRRDEIICGTLWHFNRNSEFIKTQVNKILKIQCSNLTQANLTSFYFIVPISIPSF